MRTKVTVARRLFVLCAIVVAVPLFGGLVAFLLLRRDFVVKYDACVAGLSEQQRRLPGAESIVNDLKKIERFDGLRWNLNSPYELGAINILVPATADSAWHKQCGLEETPADCLASPREKLVICNAALGRQLSNPRLTSGIIRDEVRRPLRFLALTFLGHEVGHLQAGSDSRVQHLFPMMRANGLKCRRNERLKPSEEETADDFGIAVACDALKRGDDAVIPTDARSAIDTLSFLRQNLDDDFDFDDTCAGDDFYPSVSRRKSTFAREYAKCIFPGKELPYGAVANDQDEAFKHLEAWLRTRQIGGMVGSALYGNSPLYRFDVAGTVGDRRYVAFDSTGTSAQISTTTAEGERLSHKVLAEWDRAGEVVDVRSDAKATKAAFLATFAGPNDTTVVRHAIVNCPDPVTDCNIQQGQKDLPAGVEVHGTPSHAVVEIDGKRLRTYVSSADYFDDKAVIDTPLDLDVPGITPIIAGHADRLLLAVRPAEDEQPSGFHRAAVLTRGGTVWTTFTTAPANMNPLHAAGLYGTRVAFALQPSARQLATGNQLWVCPSAPFESEYQNKVDCDVYDPPEDASYSIGVANNDLSSLGIQITEADYCPGFIVVRQGGWLWLVDPETRRQDIIPGTGLVNCDRDRGRAVVYRMRRIDEVTLDFRDANPARTALGLVHTSFEHR